MIFWEATDTFCIAFFSAIQGKSSTADQNKTLVKIECTRYSRKIYYPDTTWSPLTFHVDHQMSPIFYLLIPHLENVDCVVDSNEKLSLSPFTRNVESLRSYMYNRIASLLLYPPLSPCTKTSSFNSHIFSLALNKKRSAQTEHSVQHPEWDNTKSCRDF